METGGDRHDFFPPGKRREREAQTFFCSEFNKLFWKVNFSSGGEGDRKVFLYFSFFGCGKQSQTLSNSTLARGSHLPLAVVERDFFPRRKNRREEQKRKVEERERQQIGGTATDCPSLPPFSLRAPKKRRKRRLFDLKRFSYPFSRKRKRKRGKTNCYSTCYNLDSFVSFLFPGKTNDDRAERENILTKRIEVIHFSAWSTSEAKPFPASKRAKAGNPPFATLPFNLDKRPSKSPPNFALPGKWRKNFSFFSESEPTTGWLLHFVVVVWESGVGCRKQFRIGREEEGERRTTLAVSRERKTFYFRAVGFSYVGCAKGRENWVEN